MWVSPRRRRSHVFGNSNSFHSLHLILISCKMQSCQSNDSSESLNADNIDGLPDTGDKKVCFHI